MDYVLQVVVLVLGVVVQEVVVLAMVAEPVAGGKIRHGGQAAEEKARKGVRVHHLETLRRNANVVFVEWKVHVGLSSL